MPAAYQRPARLAKGLILDHFDDREPTFVPAPAQAAKDLADARLTDAEWSPAATAGQLHVSVRTLQRAFASLDESFSTYIRRRRLEEAAEALTASPSRLSVSEAATLWHFTDAGTSSALSRSNTMRHQRNSHAA
ncbi:helix-turn-helix domain-containing protein [Streptomyces fagopyri]|uniref:helix-turn-helix domain-containing protein n=1 Tax=Streptomyces fagopyri TaxID=2662397 RepID=UPI003827E02D